MAAGLVTLIAKSRGLIVDVRTAGLSHHPCKRVAEKAVKVMEELGVDISGEYSKPVTTDLLVWADLVVTVQKDHLDFLVEEFPDVASKAQALESDVRDPYGGPESKYREKRDELYGLLSKLNDSLEPATP